MILFFTHRVHVQKQFSFDFSFHSFSVLSSFIINERNAKLPMLNEIVLLLIFLFFRGDNE